MTKIGCSDIYAVDFATKAGVPLGATRVYAQTQAWSTGAPWDKAIQADARGERVHLTYKPAVAVASATGASEVARANSIAAGILASGMKPGVIGIYHEPEDNITAGEFTAAQWRAMQVALLPLLKQSGWRTCVCLMGWTADSHSGRNVSDYLTSAVLAVTDVVAWDPYNYSGGNINTPYCPNNPNTGIYGDPAVMFNLCLDATPAGKVPMIFETGCLKRQADTAGAERTTWWTNAVANPRMKSFGAVDHFEGQPNVPSLTAIRDEPASLAAFVKLRRLC